MKKIQRILNGEKVLFTNQEREYLNTFKKLRSMGYHPIVSIVSASGESKAEFKITRSIQIIK